MKIIRASDMGMCFGVRDALQITQEVDRPEDVTIHGELVHNAIVQDRLACKGFQQSTETGRQCGVPTPLVLITAHGISNAERNRLRAADKQLIDTTCPLVRRVHDAAMELEREGRLVLLIGKPGHVEVVGIVEDLNRSHVVPDVRSVSDFGATKLGVLSQTTMPSELVDEILSEIRRKNPSADVRFVDTVCHPTKKRQAALVDLVDRVDAVVVVGGRNSNNTRRLVEYCHRNQRPVVHVQDANDLVAEWFDDFETVGLTAGTSTLDETIDHVQSALQKIATQKRNGVRP